jgi:hypothetical protein
MVHSLKDNETDLEGILLSYTLDENISKIKEVFGSYYDLIFHELILGTTTKACFIYFADLTNRQLVTSMEQSFYSYSNDPVELITKDSMTSYIQKRFPLRNNEAIYQLKILMNHLLKGRSILLVEGKNQAYSFNTADYSGRAIEDSATERAVKGPRESFVEDLHTNLRLIRKKLRTPTLKIDFLTLGKQTNTEISIVYMEGIANEEIVREVHERLSHISFDGILDSHYIESIIRDSKLSPLPTIYQTERPDTVCGKLLDGKVAILVDGTPFVLTVPALFVEFLHSREDYYEGSLVSTAIRWFRFLGMFVALILPAFYIALTTFHQDLLQTPFLIRIAANRDGLPYTVLIEAIFMLITFELIREAGLRMPKTLGGGVVTILGLVIIGQAAVQAGIIGPVLTIVISATALISFILPNYAFHQIIRYSGFPLLILAGFFGFMGIIVGLMFGLTHIVSIRSFGVPYFTPVSPAIKEGWKDVFIRAPWWAMDTRPPGIGISNVVRSDHKDQSILKGTSKENKDE